MLGIANSLQDGSVKRISAGSWPLADRADKP
jgi:hypothetical protein